jgi:hypothetical protein
MIDELQARIAFLEEQLTNVGQSLCNVLAREEVNDSMLSALIETHPDRDLLRSKWRERSSRILPGLLVRTDSPWDKQFSETARYRAEHLNDLTD